MPVDNGEIVEVTLEGSYGSNDIQNSFHLQCLTGAELSDADALTDLIAIFEALAAIIDGLLTTTYAFNRIRVINRSTDHDVGYEDFVTTTNGAATGSAMPLQVAAVFTLPTDKFRTVGRKFIGPGTTTVYSSAGQLAAGALTDAASAIAHLVSTHQPNTATWSYGVVSTIDSLFHPFEAGSVATYVGTQRRRRPGVGS